MNILTPNGEKIDFPIMDSIPIPIAILDTELQFLSCSKKWISAHGIKKDFKGAQFSTIMENVPKDFFPVLNRCLNENSCSNEGKKFINKNGDYIWLKWDINPWYLKNGAFGGLIIVLHDVTNSKNEEELLNEAQTFSRIGAWEVNLKNNKISYTKMANVIHEEPMDYSPKTIEESLLHFKEGKQRDKMTEIIDRAIKKGIPWDIEIKSVTTKGNELWIRSKGQPQFVNGKCVRLFGICQDINDQKIAELNYTEQAERAQKAITASNVGIWQFYTKDKFTIWDEMCYKIHHVNPIKFNNPYEAWASVIHPKDFRRVLSEAFILSKGDGSGIIEYRIVLPNGSIRHLKAIATFVSEKEKYNNQAIGIIVDVTKEKEYARKLEEFSEITREQNDSLTNFAHMVSHDLRSHATNLSMVTSFLKEEKNPTEKKKLLCMLKDATESLNSTVYNLNDVVHSSNSVREQLISIALQPFVNKVLNNISVLLKEKNTRVDINISPNCMVLAVPAYLDSILLNLFTNSLKYAALERKPIIQINTTKNNNFIELTFKDNGKGIDLNKFGRKIFGMHKTFHRNKDARGVSLYITKNQIEAMGGDISVESEVNIGTTFKLKLKTPE